MPKPIKCAGKRRNSEEYLRKNRSMLRIGENILWQWYTEGEERLIAIEEEECQEIMRLKKEKGTNAILLLQLEGD